MCAVVKSTKRPLVSAIPIAVRRKIQVSSDGTETGNCSVSGQTKVRAISPWRAAEKTISVATVAATNCVHAATRPAKTS
ncbi:hypothetical protein D9M70_502810 [compost metagenome]